MSIYRINGHRIHSKDMINIENESYYKVATSLIPNIKEKMEEISDFIQGIPEKIDDITICSDARKKVYIQSMEMKIEQFFIPAYDKAKAFLQAKDSISLADYYNIDSILQKGKRSEPGKETF